MKAPYLDDGDVQLYLGDCIEVMAAMPAESVDVVVCDPPYGLEFMGKDWDAPKPSWDKRGQGAERGFVGKSRAPVPGFSAYAAGWPFQQWSEEWAREALRVLKPGGHLLAFGGTRTFHRLTCGIEDAGFQIRDCLSWLYGSGFPKSLDVSKAIDKAAGAEREVVGANPNCWTPRDNAVLGNGKGIQATGHDKNITAPATDAAREWQGWGTALKPAWEPCVVARKPLAGTVAANVQAHGTGALNVDGCRIGFASDADEREAKDKNAHAQYGSGEVVGYHGWQSRAGGGDYNPPGRWPANVVLDEQAAAMLDAQSGERKTGAAPADAASIYGTDINRRDARRAANGNDTGGASRFYYTAKASRADRNTSGAMNTHPTVKPTDLMRWLVRLVTPPGGVVLDPFAGSGSTLLAARAEGVRCIGIEREEEYARIIADRLSQLSLLSEGMVEE